MVASLQATLSNTYSWMKIFYFMKFVPNGPVNNNASIASDNGKQTTSLYPNQWRLGLLTHIHITGPDRACLFSKSSLARLREFCNSSICLYEIKRKNLFKSTSPTGSFTCPRPLGSGKRRALPEQADINTFIWKHTHTLQQRHNERDGISNHQPHDC